MSYSKGFLMKVLRTYTHTDQICFKPKKAFSPEQINNALKIYEKPIDPDNLIGIMDITISDGGKKGYLMTQDGIYSYINRYPLELDNIIHADYKESHLIITTGTGQQISWYAGMGAPYICEFLNEMSAMYDPEFDSMIEAEDATMMTIEDLALVWDNNRNEHNKIVFMDMLRKETLYLPMCPEFPSAEYMNIQPVGDDEFLMMNHVIMKPVVINDTHNTYIQLFINQINTKIHTYAEQSVVMIPVSYDACMDYLKKHKDITQVMIEAYGTQIYIDIMELLS